MPGAAETDHPEPEQISFELERLTLAADDRLKLTGRWFGVGGRRFVRPTLTLIGAHRRARSLADLEHKPWTAEDGADWVAVFPLQSPGEDVLELELAVAPDIAVSLSPPPELAQLPREPRPSRGAVVAPRGAPAPVQDPPLPETPPQAVKRKPPARRGAAALATETIEQQRLKIESLEKELERAAGSEVEPRSALARRDAAEEKLEAVLEQQQAQERQRAIAEQDRDAAERERLTALRERDEARKGWKEAHERRGEAVGERDRIAQERDRALAERDRLVSELDRVVSERDRTMDERDRALSEHPDRAPAERVSPPVPRSVMAQHEQRPRVPESRRAGRAVVWATRLLALVVLIAAIAAIAIIVHSA